MLTGKLNLLLSVFLTADRQACQSIFRQLLPTPKQKKSDDRIHPAYNYETIREIRPRRINDAMRQIKKPNRPINNHKPQRNKCIDRAGDYAIYKYLRKHVTEYF